jgi:hypothetical protein
MVCVDVSVMEVDVAVEEKEAAAVSDDTLGAKRVLAGFLEGEGESEEKWIDERGLVVALVAFTRVEAADATDLARGLRGDLGLGCSDDGFESAM